MLTPPNFPSAPVLRAACSINCDCADIVDGNTPTSALWWYGGSGSSDNDDNSASSAPSLPSFGCGTVQAMCDIKNNPLEVAAYAFIVMQLAAEACLVCKPRYFPGANLANNFYVWRHGRQLKKNTPLCMGKPTWGDWFMVFAVNLFGSFGSAFAIIVLLEDLLTSQGFVTMCSKVLSAIKIVEWLVLGEWESLRMGLGPLLGLTYGIFCKEKRQKYLAWCFRGSEK